MTLIKGSRLQRKGQVTIPSEIREKLGLQVGDLVAFEETDQGFIIKPQQVVDREELRKLEGALQNLRELNQALSRAAKAEGLTPEELDRRVEATKDAIFRELYG
jgi:AbrB family looped-hinge helix DNA binding protein